MKKATETLFLIAGVLIFFASYMYDVQVKLSFKDLNFPILDAPLSIITNFSVVIVIFLVIPSMICYKNNRKSVYLLWTTFAVSIVLAFLIKLIVLRQRPIEAFTYPFINIINYSFPSMHSMVVFALLPLLARYIPRHKFFWIIFAFLVAFSRIYFSLHFLSDVVFGSLAGFAVGVYILKLHEKGKLWKLK